MDFDTIILVIAEFIGVIAVGMFAGISPQLRKVRPLQFLFPRREARVTLSVNATLFVFAIIIYLQFFTSQGKHGVFQPEVLWQRIFLDVLVLAVFAAALFTRKQPIRSALLGKDALRANLQFAFLIAALVIFLRGRIFAIINGISPDEGLALFQYFIIAICEVTIFFGYSQPRLSSRFGEIKGWMIASALFALWQIIPLALHGASGNEALFQIGLALGYGLILGWITPKSRHIIAPAVYLALSQWLFLLQ